jgi:excisionase family DNA binding protein
VHLSGLPGDLTSKGADMGRGFGEPLLTVVEVANIMRVSNMTVYRLIKSGQLSAIRVGKNYRIRRADMDRYLTDRAVRIDD